MGELPDNHELVRQPAVLQERMKTMQADYKTDIAMLGNQIAERDAELAKRIAERDAELGKQIAKRDAEQARRDRDNLRWQVGLWIVAVVILGVLIRWPA